MSDPTRVLAVIPARGGSRGLPGKNIRPLCGLPLIAHSIRAAQLIPSVSRCIVSTDDPEVAAVATSLGGEAPFVRPRELATAHTPMAPVLTHALAFVENQEARPYDVVVLLDPTSPAREPADVEAALRLLLDRPEYDGVVSVSQPTFNPLWVGVRGSTEDPARMERYFPEAAGVTRRQDAPRLLRVNGNFYLWRAEFVRDMPAAWMDEGVHGMVEIPERRAFAIDTLEEFEQLQALVDQGLLALPGATPGP
jgi:N-acylneuraminate cytidylyltransferase